MVEKFDMKFKSSTDAEVKNWNGIEFEPSQIRHVDRAKKKETHQSIKRVLSLCISWYRSFIKPIPIARLMVLICWNIVHPIYIRLILISSIIKFYLMLFVATLKNNIVDGESNKWKMRKRKLTKMSQYSEENSLHTIVIFSIEEISTPAPMLSNNNNTVYLKSPHEKYLFPEVNIVDFGVGEIYGGTNHVVVNDQVVCHELFDSKLDYTSEEYHGRIKIYPASDQIRILQHDSKAINLQIAEASSFVDSCASNYAHWLTEVLPRIAVFCSLSEHKNVPLILNSDLHANIMQSVRIMAGPKRGIILLSVGRTIEVASLKQVTVAGYVPYDKREPLNESLTNQGKFSRKAINEVRAKTFLAIDERKKEDRVFRSIAPEKEPGNFKKIYLKRNSGVRKVTNSEEIEHQLESAGFSIIEPEKLDYLAQVNMFKNADTIVASSGAALANIIFCGPETNIVILISKLKGTSYWYWQNIACASGNRVKYVMGESVNPKNHGIHSDFKIDLDELFSLI